MASNGLKDFQEVWKLAQLVKKAGWNVKSSGDFGVVLCPHEKPYPECEELECVVRHVMES